MRPTWYAAALAGAMTVGIVSGVSAQGPPGGRGAHSRRGRLAPPPQWT